MRARDLGIVIGSMPPGPHNAITDVEGVLVGHATLVEGDGPLVVGRGPVRTGVTVIRPHPGYIWEEPLFAGCHRLNGAGEMTGLEWVRESGLLTTPIAITNTHSVGVVHDALIAMEATQHPPGALWYSLPVAAETYDGVLNDINGFHVRREHVETAFRSAANGPVTEGCVGGGTGMITHGFKAGIGTSSRSVATPAGTFTVGVLVQSNYGERDRLRVNGVAVGRRIPATEVPTPVPPSAPREGSIIVIVATDAPLGPHQCDRLAQRAALGVGRMGGAAGNGSGDLMLAFATGNRGRVSGDFAVRGPSTGSVEMLANSHLNPLFFGVIEATEEAILNALVAAETMTGPDGATAHAIPHDRLVEIVGVS